MSQSIDRPLTGLPAAARRSAAARSVFELIARWQIWLLPALYFAAGLTVPLLFYRSGLRFNNVDAFEYLRGASSLTSGHGFLGMDGRPDTLFPPGYSFAIAGASFLFGDALNAALFISWLASAAGVALLFLLGRRLFGSWVGAVAALLFAMYAPRVWTAQQPVSESWALVLVLFAVWAYTHDDWPAVLRGVAVGSALGLGFLTRPDAFLVACALLTVAVVRSLRNRRERLVTAVAICALLCFVAPYSAWLHAQTGTWSLSGKTRLDLVKGVAQSQGIPDVRWRHLNAAQNAEVVGPAPARGILVRHYLSNVRTLLSRTLYNIGGSVLGRLLLALGILVVLLRALRRREWEPGALLLTLLAPAVMLPLFWIDDRFLLQLAPALLLVVAVGAVQLAAWARGLLNHPAAILIAAVCVAAVLNSDRVRLQGAAFAADDIQASRTLAALLAPYASGHKNIAEIGDYPAVAYDSGIRHIWLPYTNLNALRTFARKSNAPFLVLSPQDSGTPATREILAGSRSGESRFLGQVRAGHMELRLYQILPSVQEHG